MTLRRVPSQERSKKRFEAIVAAAAELFAEAGFERTTIEAIATRSGSSVGSLYQFFPNKRSIFRAMAERTIARSRELHAQVLLQHVGSSWEEMLDASIDVFFRELKENPGTRALHANPGLYHEYAVRDRALLDEFAVASQRLLVAQVPGLSQKRAQTIGRVLVQTTASLVVLAGQYPNDESKIREEAKRMTRYYLQSHLAAKSSTRNEPGGEV